MSYESCLAARLIWISCTACTPMLKHFVLCPKSKRVCKSSLGIPWSIVLFLLVLPVLSRTTPECSEHSNASGQG